MSVVPSLPTNLTSTFAAFCIESKSYVVLVLAGSAAQELSPLKKLLEVGVPVADNSAVIVPAVVIVPPVTFTNVPLLVATEVTVPTN